MALLNQIVSIALLILGFGFVIFWHELGHFIAAKWVGIKVEQFAVGFGQALFSWRKGLGVRFGSSSKEFEERVTAHAMTKIDAEKTKERLEVTHAQFRNAAADLGYSETEYRLNWIPLGGYVKMLGQDDLKPNAEQEDPRAYNKQSIPARMLVVSAGVIMNIILAAIGFMVLFMMGFNAPPAVVGGIMPLSPADKAGIQTGDRIVALDGRAQSDFTKIALNVALVEEGTTVPITLLRNGKEITTTIKPERVAGDPKGFLAVGINQPLELRGLDPRDVQLDESARNRLAADAFAVKPGDVITAINGKPLEVTEYSKEVETTKPDAIARDYRVLDDALQSSNGRPVELTIKDTATGQLRQATIQPSLERLFTRESINFAGASLRPEIEGLQDNSPALDKLKPGDVITAVDWGDGAKSAPTSEDLMKYLNEAGQNDKPVKLTILRAGKPITLDGIVPSYRVVKGRKGLGIALGLDASHAVVADVEQHSPMEKAGLTKGSTITAINGAKVESWFDVLTALKSAKPGSVPIEFTNDAGEAKSAQLDIPAEELTSIQSFRYTHSLLLHERIEPRKTSDPFVAARWGLAETRDFVLQFYLTIRRMVQGSVSRENVMGPVGILVAGTKFAFKGMDWLIWFLCMISANLAVVNFLPIPIVDGGLFTFLIIEKLMGRPLSPKAQQVAQFVGLGLILGVFLLVTYQDIARFFGA